MITLEHVVDNLIEKENKLYPDLIYPDIKTRKKRTALGMKYLGIYHTQVAYRIYPQLSTSSKYQAFYE